MSGYLTHFRSTRPAALLHRPTFQTATAQVFYRDIEEIRITRELLERKLEEARIATAKVIAETIERIAAFERAGQAAHDQFPDFFPPPKV